MGSLKEAKFNIFKKVEIENLNLSFDIKKKSTNIKKNRNRS